MSIMLHSSRVAWNSCASARSCDLLARTKNPSCPNRKLLVSHPVFPDGHKTVLDAIREYW